MDITWRRSVLALLSAAAAVAIGCRDEQRPNITAPPAGPQAVLTGGTTILDEWNGGPLHGAIFTTLPFGQSVNANVQYHRKIEVYLDGGPRNPNSMAAGLNDGLYVFQITDPPGKVLLSQDPARCRVVQVNDGVILGTVPVNRIPGYATDAADVWGGNGQTKNKPCHIESSETDGASLAGQHDTNIDTDPGGGTTVQMMPFLDTPNPGGVYKAWITPLAVYLEKGGNLDAVPTAKGQAVGYPADLGFKNPSRKNVKTDNFKVVEKPPYIQITKYVNGAVYSGWPVTMYEYSGTDWVGAGWKPSTATFAVPFGTSVLACEKVQAGYFFDHATIDGATVTPSTALTVDEDGKPIVCVSVPAVTTPTTVAVAFYNVSVSAKITISPPTATNGIYDPHTLTAKVQINDGDPNSYVNAPNGLRIDFAILSGPGTLTPTYCLTSGGTGSCSVTLNSSVTGTTKIEASTTIDHSIVPVLPSGTEIKIKTDGTGDNSGPAEKIWIAGSLQWEKQDMIGNRIAGATFQVCRTRNYTYATSTFTDITPECFTPDILDNDTRDVSKTDGVFKLTNLRLGTYTVKETIAPDGYLPDPRTLTANVTSATLVTIGPFLDNMNGRMTGGSGKVILDLPDGSRFLTSGFTIHCDILLSNNLEINWKDEAGNARKWHITKPIQTAKCTDNPAVQPGQPTAFFDTFEGTAVGELDGVAGSWVEFVFVDAGEPGKSGVSDLPDMVRLRIWSGAIGTSTLVQSVVGTESIPGYTGLATIRGNFQAHLDQPHK